MHLAIFFAKMIKIFRRPTMDYRVIEEMEKVNAQTYFTQVRALIEEGNLIKMKEFTLNHLDEMPNIANYITHNRSNWHFDLVEILISNKPHSHSALEWIKYFHEELNIEFTKKSERNDNNLLQYLIDHANRLENIGKMENEIFEVFDYLLSKMSLNTSEQTDKICTMLWRSKPQLRKIILPLFEKNDEYQKKMEEGLNKTGDYKNNPLLFEIIKSHYSTAYENFIEFYNKFHAQVNLAIKGASYNHNIFFTITHGVRNAKTHDLFTLITQLLKKENKLDLFYEINPKNETVLSDLSIFLLLNTKEEEEVHKTFRFIIDNFPNLTPLILHKTKDGSIYENIYDYPSKRDSNKQLILNYFNIILEKEELENKLSNKEMKGKNNKL